MGAVTVTGVPFTVSVTARSAPVETVRETAYRSAGATEPVQNGVSPPPPWNSRSPPSDLTVTPRSTSPLVT